MDSSHRRLAISSDWPAGTCLPAARVSVDSIRSKTNSSTVCSLSLQSEPRISMCRGSIDDVFHYLEPAPTQIEQPLLTHSPRIVASKNSEEWIA